MSELVLWILRLAVLGLMYLFLLALMLSLRADLRAASAAPAQTPPTPQDQPAPKVAPTEPQALTVVAGTSPRTGTEYALLGVLDIGRDPACAISIPNRFISGHHARIFQQQGKWLVEDLGSTNGSLINGKPLTAPHPLTVGDKLAIGDTEFLVK